MYIASPLSFLMCKNGYQRAEQMLDMTCFMLQKLDQVKRWVDEPLAAPVRLHLTLLDFKPLLTLFRPVGGGGGVVPALTLDVHNFFRMQAKPIKLGDFS